MLHSIAAVNLSKLIHAGILLEQNGLFAFITRLIYLQPLFFIKLLSQRLQNFKQNYKRCRFLRGFNNAC